MSEMTWFNPPPRCEGDPATGTLRVWPAEKTDFWRTTHYGFEADSGHFLQRPVHGDFVMHTHVAWAPAHQYDQAGLMVRVSPTCWLKTAVEFEPEGPSRLGAVVTNAGLSDWSTQDVPTGLRALWLRVRREGRDYWVEAGPDGQHWSQLRLARLHADDGGEVQAGLYACSPRGAGFVAAFSGFGIV